MLPAPEKKDLAKYLFIGIVIKKYYICILYITIINRLSLKISIKWQ